ncbi:hypothetical protein CHS0354_006905 [Potamilus streckersoni]|uniref:Uncharacterized protein n=1 Tax=Potamilus streckersoni TaxID=2493646 RepID=A0AAE0WC73_9BIVA|nr:hypothetical protein CHS0354_006905 [Potamilus streckersoni]
MKIKKQNNIKSVALGIIALSWLVSACSITKIDNIDEFKPYDVEQAEIMPPKEALESVKTKVAVYDIDNINDVSKGASAAQKVTEQVKKYLLEANVELVDRSAADKYKDEIILASQNSGTFSGPVFASYVLQGTLSEVTFSVSLEKSKVDLAYNAYAILNKKQTTEVEDYCQYTGKLSGALALYSMPDLKVVKQFEFSDSRSYDTAPNRSVKNVGDFAATLFTGKVPGECPQITASWKNWSMRPHRKRLYRSMYRRQDVYLAKITVGKNANLTEGMKVEVYSLKPVSNSLTGKVETEERRITEAYVTNQITDKSAWIVFEKPETQAKLKSVVFEKGKFESFKDIF